VGNGRGAVSSGPLSRPQPCECPSSSTALTADPAIVCRAVWPRGRLHYAEDGNVTTCMSVAIGSLWRSFTTGLRGRLSYTVASGRREIHDASARRVVLVHNYRFAMYVHSKHPFKRSSSTAVCFSQDRSQERKAVSAWQDSRIGGVPSTLCGARYGYGLTVVVSAVTFVFVTVPCSVSWASFSTVSFTSDSGPAWSCCSDFMMASDSVWARKARTEGVGGLSVKGGGPSAEKCVPVRTEEGGGGRERGAGGVPDAICGTETKSDIIRGSLLQRTHSLVPAVVERCITKT